MPQADIGPALHGTPAAYGRACTNCARAKCRCIYRSEGASCDRCHRLNKDCTPSVSARRRSNKRQASSRTAQLEEKLEDLVTMLRNQNSVKPDQFVQNAGVGIPTPGNNSPSEPSANGNSSSSNKASPCEFDPDAFCNGRQGSTLTTGSMIPIPNTPASRLEAEKSLHAFRTHYLETFPCVYIPPTVTAEQLREEKPLMWLSIMMVTCQSAHEQLTMNDTIRKIVAEKLVIGHEKSMDMLLGLLVFLGWSHYHRKDKPYASVFSQLAISLIFDLSLHKPPGENSMMACFKSPQPNAPMPGKERTMEDRRAILACFHVTSQVSFTMKKMQGLVWTPYMDECLNELARNPESPRDELLASQVRMQLIVEQIGRAPWQFSEPQSGPPGPPFSYLNALHSQREKIKSKLPAGLERRVFIELQLHYTKLVTLESGLARNPSTSLSNPDFRRYDICSKSLETTKDWFDVFFSIPASDYPAIGFTFWCQLMHCVISLYKLTTLDEPAWDHGSVRDTIDLIGVCDKIGAQFETVATNRRIASGMQPGQDHGDEDMFFKSTRMISTMKARWEAELAMMHQAPATRSAAGGVTNGFVSNMATDPLAVPMMVPDDVWAPDNMWLTNIFNVSWE